MLNNAQFIAVFLLARLMGQYCFVCWRL